MATRATGTHPERIRSVPHAMIVGFCWPMWPFVVTCVAALLVVSRHASEGARIPSCNSWTLPECLKLELWKFGQSHTPQRFPSHLGNMVHPQHQDLGTFCFAQCFCGVFAPFELCILFQPPLLVVIQACLAPEAQIFSCIDVGILELRTEVFVHMSDDVVQFVVREAAAFMQIQGLPLQVLVDLF